MVWCGISVNGALKPIFVEPGVKINAQYYIKHVLKPFLKSDARRLYPDMNFIFHQDSAPSHTAKSTLKYLKDNKVSFITPLQWMPSSPDAAPMDYCIWGYIKNKLCNKMLQQFKRLKTRFAKPSGTFHVMKSWSRRCRRIYYNKGSYIERK
ncbi:uncharacterized protein B4U80_04996 [Leptotrombidium deliense]|uniref:Tc1-like transposase DDE domain-containing protein n=1 Tax=Leptotrombidium deliense TaxID=299467 RepID=A0A443QAA4_9ACAR|nr:uncharacterized protein B4U80_04996 [Leptotrombidium deliense]